MIYRPQIEEFRVDHPLCYGQLEKFRGQVVGAYLFPIKTKFAKRRLQVIASNGQGWDHVSISNPLACPSWDEMCAVKEIFFAPEEVVMQLHVAAKNHINIHPNCLHLWRPQSNEEIAKIRDDWVKSGEGWPYGDLLSPGAIPLPPLYCV